MRRSGLRLVVLAAAAAAAGVIAAAQAKVEPTNSAPNPYTTIEGWAKLPDGRPWGSLSAVDIDPDGKSIWIAERCGANRCVDPQGQVNPVNVIVKFDENGNVVTSFASGLIVSPHGMHVDRQGNVWVTDWQDNFPSRGRGAAADAPAPPPPAKPMGHQVFKFSPTGKLLMVMGKPGGNRPGETPDPSSFYQVNDVITNAAGEIFVAEGHSSNATAHARISKFDRTGKFIKAWGTRGSAPNQLDQPHAFAWDSKGRLFVADRSNNRIVIYDQDGNLLDHGWEQYSRISGLWIDPNDMLYAADSESGSVAPTRPEWQRGIRIGSVREGKNGKIHSFIPDPNPGAKGTSAAEGVAVDRAGNIYGAEVGPRALKKYVRKK
jgi:sugar lactone lactonase YvrE